MGILESAVGKLAGTAIASLGKAGLSHLLAPAQTFENLRAATMKEVLLRRDLISNSGVGDRDFILKASETLRGLATEWEMLSNDPRAVTTLATGEIIDRDAMLALKTHLIGLSNRVTHRAEGVLKDAAKYNRQDAEAIAKLLGFRLE